MYSKIKTKIYDIINSSKVFEVIIIAIIIVNTGSVVAETFSLSSGAQAALNVIEKISVAIF